MLLIYEKINILTFDGHIKDTLEKLEPGIFDLIVHEKDIMGQEWWQFKIDEVIVGYGWIDFTDNCEISFVVVEEFRKKRPSFGLQIIEQLENICKDKPISQIEAIIKTSNPYSEAVISLLFKLGYKNNMFETKDDVIKFAKDLKGLSDQNILMKKYVNLKD